MVPRHRSIATIIVVLAIALAGCAGGPLSSEDRSGDEIRTDSLSAIDDVESYTFNATLSVDTGSTMVPMGAVVTANGTVDLRNQRLHSTVSIPTRGETETYITNDSLHTADASGEWTNRSLETNYFETREALEGHKTMLKNASVEHEGTQELDGRTVNVLNASVEDVRARTLLESLLGPENATAVATDVGGVLDDVTIQTADVAYYTGQSDDLLYRVTVDATLLVDGQSIPATLTMDFDDYDEDVHVAVPPAATS